MKGIFYFSGFGDKCSLMRQSTGEFECRRIIFAFFRSLAGRSLLSFAFFLLPFALFSQAPQGFNYQAVVRDANGKILANQAIGLRISILQGNESGTVVYSEQHTVTTNSQGLVVVVVGKGTAETGTFADIDWNKGPWYLKVEVDENGGSDYKTLGVSALMSVPYALQAGTVGSLTRLNIRGDDVVSDSALFVVRRKDGQIVFAVYNDSVVVHVNDAATKGPRGGFVVGGFTLDKGNGRDYMRVTPDSVRIYINDQDIKRPRGGFAINGFGPLKGAGSEYFHVSGLSSAEVIHGENRVVWYPRKNAFLAGRVLVESPDSVGTNSFAIGYEPKSIGEYSQALGYQARAKGDNSTAIGNNANAVGAASYAFGNSAVALDSGSYAIGSGAVASGLRSFALGSVGVDTTGKVTAPTKAIGDYAYAFGMGSVAMGEGSFAIGTQDTAVGRFSMAMGELTKASGSTCTAMGFGTSANYKYTTAMGYKSVASDKASIAMGWQTIASDRASVAMGYQTKASGDKSTAMGDQTIASGVRSTAMGSKTTASGGKSIAMGFHSIASGESSTAMGDGTEASGDGSFAMGRYTEASGEASMALGYYAKASGRYSTALGDQTTASGEASTTMGYNTTASGDYSTAIGYKSSTNDKKGSFVYGDASTSGTIEATADNQFKVRASGGTWFYSKYNLSSGVYLSPGGGSWQSVSDSAKKENFRKEDPDIYLRKLSGIPIQSWNYKSQDPGIRHIGVVAQDFYKTFGFGENDTTLTWIDVAGVNMVAIKGLITKTREMEKQLEGQQQIVLEQKQEIERLKAENGELAALRKEVEELKRVLGAMARQK